jgi:DNA-directed RNA polymerase specialized sigma24 family protein
MSDVTQILSQIESGDPSAAEQLLPLVYDELRKLAQENPGQTLQATALVHEAYIRLVGVEKAQHWNSRRHEWHCRDCKLLQVQCLRNSALSTSRGFCISG